MSPQSSKPEPGLGPFSPETTRLVLVMVGLPARGKTYIARKIARFLNWLGFQTRVFNAGDYRRRLLGAHHRHEFFDPANPEGKAARREMADRALDDLLAYMRGGGQVGIYDATNSTQARRAQVWDRLTTAGCQVVFIESLCEDPTIIEGNIRETKLRSPDYEGMDPEEAARDFRARIEHYIRVYEPVTEESFPYIKLIDVGRVMVMHRIQGYLAGKLVFFLMNLHVVRRPIWLTRHGESEANVMGRIGGDSLLTERGKRYAQVLSRFVREHAIRPPTVWTSTLRRAVQTAEYLPVRAVPWRALDEIDAGVCDSMTYAEIAAQMPDEYAARKADKLRYRYPRGESYQDVILRLEPVIIELERQQAPVLVIAHQAVLRALYAYFTDRHPEECLHMEIPLHTVIELTPGPYGYDERRFSLEVDGLEGAGDSMRE